jgi:hypothetical protein
MSLGHFAFSLAAMEALVAVFTPVFGSASVLGFDHINNKFLIVLI